MSRGLKVFFFALVVPGALLGSLPWWLGAALRPVLRAQGIAFGRYERDGYADFRLHDVTYASRRFTVSAGEVQSLTPMFWLGQRLRGGEPVLAITDWTIQFAADGARLAAGATEVPRRLAGMPDLQAALRKIGPQLVRWLPRARLQKGVVHGLGPEMLAGSADWHNGALAVTNWRVARQVIDGKITFKADGTATLEAHTAGDTARLNLAWSGVDLKGTAAVWGQPLEVAARFPARGWLPAAATVTAAHWQLPAARAGLGAPYAQVQGDARFVWSENTWELSLDARAEPATEPKTGAPPFTARAAAHGTLHELTLAALAVDTPFATATLTAPVTFSFDHPPVATSALLTVRADLAKLPWFEARGKVEGTVRVSGGTASASQLFDLRFTDVAGRIFSVRSAVARGELLWPRLELSDLDVQLDDSSRVQAHGAVNWQTRELSGVVLQAKLTPAWLARSLPAGCTWATAEISATVAGPLDAPHHAGSLKLTGATWPPLHPVALEISWQGEGAQAEIRAARALAGHSSVALAGTVDRTGFQLSRLQITAAGQSVWTLANPARLDWSPVWQVDDLQLHGPGGGLALKGRIGSDRMDFSISPPRVSIPPGCGIG